MIFSMRRPARLRKARPRALTTPVETVDWKPNGLPMAMTTWPTRRAAESPRLAKGRPAAFTRITARSVAGSVPTISPARVRPSSRVAWRSRAWATTWSLVRI